ncbi:hypothetical protein [Endozoicomonas sp. ALB032]|uniref:hypothetical protein n=1 Tax=Endozoicomonas sp. ALB032 TaxID=3403082 RepID=UPI003BB692D9
MTLEQFKSSPWQKSHALYAGSPYSITPAPEYANSEVLMASLYRNIGYVAVSESQVPAGGRQLEKIVNRYLKKESHPGNATLAADTFHTLIQGVLESPKLPRQSTQRFISVTPLVPEVSRFSGSARNTGSSWNPGGMIKNMVWLGSCGHDQALNLWRNLFESLSIVETDDVFARWLNEELHEWNPETANWAFQEPEINEVRSLSEDISDIQFPAKQFVKDLDALIAVKKEMTRRQWVSLFEAMARQAIVCHVLWLCEVNMNIWFQVRSALTSEPIEADFKKILYPSVYKYLEYGNRAISKIRDYVAGYLIARMNINAVLWSLDEKEVAVPCDLSSSTAIRRFCCFLSSNSENLGVESLFSQLEEQEMRTIRCKKGIGSNMIEFARHMLGQRETSNDKLRNYDQGYVLKKLSGNKSTPTVTLGPVSVLANTHCALWKKGGMQSIDSLTRHLSAYGIAVDDIIHSDLCQQLRVLGLVLDSPDAETGMLMTSPFELD